MDFIVSYPSQNTRRMGHPAYVLARYGLHRFLPFAKYAKDEAPGTTIQLTWFPGRKISF
jgi:hypothetical protein